MGRPEGVVDPSLDDEPPDKGRRIVLRSAANVADDVPVWAWQYSGGGRIQLSTLGLYAGRPGAGKSTAARWFAAGFSNGTVDGCWCGKPQNIAYIAPAEESVRYVIKPGLRAAGADLDRITFPEVFEDDKQVRLLSITDEQELTRQLRASNTTVVIVDPLMSTIGGNVDIHRNNEVRAYVEPWARIAERIGGIVIGVVHLTKAATAMWSPRSTGHRRSAK